MAIPSRFPSPARYGSVAISLHWLMALLIVVVAVLGLLHDTWPKAIQAFWINAHAMVGLVVVLLVFIRLWWRSGHPPPKLPADAGDISARFAGPVHGLLYALLIAIPVVGVVTFIWHGRIFDFGLFKWNLGVKSNRAIFHPTETVHGYLAYGLFGLAGLHTLAALWHHFVRHDGVLARMWPSQAPH